MASTKVPSELIANSAITGQHLHTNLGNTGVTANSSGLFIGQDVSTSSNVQFNVATASHAGTIAAATTGTTQANTDNSAKIATTAFVTNKVTELIGGAPGTLDTLNELAAAINDDANYNSTLTTALATKAPIASPTFTGTGRMNGDWVVGAATGEDKFVTAPQAAGSGTILISYNDAGNAYEPLTVDFETIALRTSGTPRLSIDSSGNIALAGNLTTTGTIDGVDIAARDAILTSTTSALSTKLPLAGGTMTGGLNIHTSTSQGLIVRTTANAEPFVALQRNSGSNGVAVLRSLNGGSLAIDTGATGAGQTTALTIDSSQMAHFEGNLYAAQSIYVGDDVRLSSDGNGELGIGYGQTATSNRFTVYNNTTAAFQVKPDGKVGIGTNNPNKELHLLSSSINKPMIKIESTGTNSYPGFQIVNDAQTWEVSTHGAHSDALTFYNGSTHTFALATNGNVGIGTTSPDAKLHVQGGDLLIQKGTGTTSVSELGFTNAFDTAFLRSSYTNPSLSTETYLAFHTNTSGATNGTVAEQMRIVGNKVGIGTDSPSVPLHINSTSAVSNRLAIFESDINNLNEYSTISVGSSTLSANFGLMLTASDTAYIGVGSSGNVFDPTTETGLYVNANGKVGIGTDTPGATLHIGGPEATPGGTAGTVDRLYIQPYSNTGGPYKFVARTVSGSSDFLDMYYGANHIISYGLDGKVGIGTTDQIGEKLTVNGSVQVLGNNDPNYSAKFISGYDSTHGLRITTRINDTTESEVLGVFANSGGAAPRLVLNPTNGWNVGIGVTNPAAALEVARGSAGYAGIFGAPQGSGKVILFKDNHASPTKYNWLFGTQYNVNNAFEITPSTVVGGYTFSTPSILVTETGAVGIKSSAPSSRLELGNLPDADWITFEQSGRKNALGGYFSSSSTGTLWKIKMTTGATNGAMNEIFQLSSAGALSFMQNSGKAPIEFHGTGTGTYNKTVLYTGQNDTSGNYNNGIHFEMGRLTDSSTAEVRAFVVGARGGQSSFKVTDSAAGVTQADGDYVVKMHETGADGYVDLFTGEATPVIRTRIASYGTSYFTPTGNTVTNQALVSVGETLGARAGVLNVRSLSDTAGGIRHRMAGGTQYLNIASTQTGSGTIPYWHIKTNAYYNYNLMFIARVHGYAYGNSGHIIDMQRSGYAYSGSSTALVGSQFVNNGSYSSAALDPYYTSAGQLCFRAYAGASSYYTGLAFDIKMQSPTGYNFDFVVEAHNLNATSGNYYT